MTEKIDMVDYISNYPESPEQPIEISPEPTHSSENESILFKLKTLNSKLKLTSIWNLLWTLITFIGILSIGTKKEWPLLIVSIIIMFLTLLPCLIFWNTCEIKKLLKRKTEQISSVELDDSLNESREFQVHNHSGMLTVDGPSSTVKVKNLRYASVYNKGGHYLDYNKQRCRIFFLDFNEKIF
jgi:hypothetical protein